MTMRRDFLAFTAGAVVAKTVLPVAARAEGGRLGFEDTPAAQPDAELIQVCAEFVSLELQTREIYASPLDDDAADAAVQPGHLRKMAILDRMADIRATTADGIQARAHALAEHNRDMAYSLDHDETMAGRLVGYLLRDAAALGGSHPFVPMVSTNCLETSWHPDAAVLAALSEFDAVERHINSHYSGGANEIVDDHERDAVLAPIWDTNRAPLERACRLQAVTLAGLQARAKTIVGENLDLDPAVDALEGYTSDRLIAALLRDLLAMGDA
jgi:hypothetical protein